jgi:hypothetical protein
VRTRGALEEHREQEQREGEGKQPERDVVHARECHVRRADHQRDEPVGIAADHRRHDHEEDHDQAVGGGEHIVHVLAGIERGVGRGLVDQRGKPVEDLDARLLELEAHGAREQRADHTRDDREHKVHRADVLVVGRVDVAAPTGGMSVVLMLGVVAGD